MGALCELAAARTADTPAGGRSTQFLVPSARPRLSAVSSPHASYRGGRSHQGCRRYARISRVDALEPFQKGRVKAAG